MSSHPCLNFSWDMSVVGVTMGRFNKYMFLGVLMKIHSGNGQKRLLCFPVESKPTRPSHTHTWVVLIFPDLQFDQIFTLLQDLLCIFSGAVPQSDVVDGQQLITRLQRPSSVQVWRWWSMMMTMMGVEKNFLKIVSLTETSTAPLWGCRPPSGSNSME